MPFCLVTVQFLNGAILQDILAQIMENARVFKMSLASFYPHYINKVEKKGRTQAELETVICWLTGYDAAGLQRALEQKVSLGDFFANAPQLHPNASKITGVICGYRVEDIQDPFMQKVRYMDKLVDELAKGRKLEKILRA